MPHAIKSYFPGKLSYLIESIIKIKEELYVTVVTINAIYLKKVIKIGLKFYSIMILRAIAVTLNDGGVFRL